jgi:magnesium chelatase subunit I
VVDTLLDSPAMGVNTIECEGVSFSHPARFTLVGTMNPEEGDLRPQFLDRFGLSLTIRSITDINMRREIARRRIAFDQDPEAFCRQWEPADRLIAEHIARARQNLAGVTVSGAMIDLAVRLSTAVEAQGHRAEIAIIKAAKAMAAIMEQPGIEKDHIADAARLVLPHRITRVALATPEILEQTLEEALRKEMAVQSGPAQAAAHDTAPDDCEEDDVSTEVPGSWAASNTDMIFAFLEDKKKLFLTPMT